MDNETAKKVARAPGIISLGSTASLSVMYSRVDEMIIIIIIISREITTTTLIIIGEDNII